MKNWISLKRIFKNEQAYTETITIKYEDFINLRSSFCSNCKKSKNDIKFENFLASELGKNTLNIDLSEKLSLKYDTMLRIYCRELNEVKSEIEAVHDTVKGMQKSIDNLYKLKFSLKENLSESDITFCI